MRSAVLLFAAGLVAAASATIQAPPAPNALSAAATPQNYCQNTPVSYVFTADDGWPMGFVWPGTSGTLRCVQATSDRAPAGLEVVVMCNSSATGQLSVLAKYPPTWNGIDTYQCPPGGDSFIIGVVNRYASKLNPVTVWYNFHFEVEGGAQKMLTAPRNH